MGATNLGGGNRLSTVNEAMATGRPTFRFDDSIETLCQQERSGLVRLAWLLTGSRETAEDVVNDAFLSLGHRPSPPNDPKPYLRRIVVNKANDHHRRASIERRYLPTPAQPTFNPDVDEVWELLAKLPDRQRHVLVLRYYEDLTLEQTADLLQCPVGTVKSLASRGLASLKTEATL